jgi:aminopeptidase N
MNKLALAFAAVLSISGCRTAAPAPDDAAQLFDDLGDTPPTPADLVEVDQKAPHLSNGKIDVLSYDLDLTFASMAAVDVPIVARVKAVLLVDSADVRLHMHKETLTVRSVTVAGQTSTFKILPGKAGANGLEGDVLSIDLQGVKPAKSTVDLVIRYVVKTSSHRDRGLTFRAAYEGAPIFVTRNWPYYARYWLPSNDHPADTATFSFELHTPADTVGAANGALSEGTYREGSGIAEGGLRTFKWRQSTPIPVYGVNVTVGPLDILQEEVCVADDALGVPPGSVTDVPADCAGAAHQVPVVFYVQKNNAERDEFLAAAKKGARSLVFFSSLLDLYPYQKLGFVTAPHPFNMESVSLIVMVSPEATVHEVAHHWWGNTVYFKHWGDFWISEGFTTYFTGLYDEFVDGTNTACSQTSGRLNGTPETDPLDIFDNTPYCKGSAAIADLRVAVAQLAGVHGTAERELFFRLVRELFASYKFKRLTTERLIAWLTERVGPVIKASGAPEPTAPAVAAKLATWRGKWFASP